METSWAEIDGYMNDRLLDDDPVLAGALRRAEEAGLPPLHVAPNQGKMLNLLARLCGARLVLELGTLGGYSTIWLARALPSDGRLITLEADEAHAAVAARNLVEAGVEDLVDIRVGPALETLPRLEAGGPFDMIFIDADKENNPPYLEWALRLSRPGTLIVVDNVVRGGAIVDMGDHDPAIAGTRRMFDALAGVRAVDATAIQTVGSKGHDGLLMAIVTGEPG
jgi:predicted O-methyltransferase YrrM